MNIPLEIAWDAFAVQVSLKVALLLAAALLLAYALKRAPAALRHTVWASALLGALLIPVASAFLPAWPVAVIPAVAAPPAAAPGSAARPVGVELRGATADVSVASAAPRSAPVVPAVAAASADRSAAWQGWLFGVWALGAGLIMLRLLIGVGRLWLLGRRSTMITDPAWLGRAHGLAQRLELNRGVTLLLGPRGMVPMTWGVLQPVILLPAEAEEWCDERRALVLAHELAHVRRRDALTQWIGQLALALHWFNPLLWLAARRLREERERACDDAVLTLGTSPVGYAGHLLDLVRALGSAPRPGPAMAMARRSELEGRLVSVLDRRVRRRAANPKVTSFATGLTLAALIPLAALSPIPATVELTDSARHAAPAQRTGAIDGSDAPGALRERAAPAPAALAAVDSPLPSYGQSADARNLLTWSDAAGRTAELHTLGKIEFSADGAEIRRLTPGGYLRLEAGAASGTRSVEVRPGADGEPRYAYFVDGAPAARGAAARAWLAPVNTYLAFRASDEQRTNAVAERTRVLEAAARTASQTRGSARAVEGSRVARSLAADTLPAPARPEAHSARDRRARTSIQRLTGTHHGRPSFELSIDMRDVVLTADRAAIAEILPGGVLVVDEERFAGHPDTDTPIARRLRVTPAPGGEPQYDYRVNGVGRQFDAEARAWLAALLRKHVS